MLRTIVLGLTGLVVFVVTAVVGAQAPARPLPPPASLPAFEAISIRPNVTEGRGGRGAGQFQPGRYVAQNVTLKTILKRAYGTEGAGGRGNLDLFDDRVVGGPDWINTDKFDIVATAPGATPPAQMRLMLQRALADRFKVAAHWETRELPVYVLIKARPDGRLGDGLTRTSDADCEAARGAGAAPMPPTPGTPAPPPPCGGVQFGPGQLIARGAPMEFLAPSFTNIPVVTGIDRMVLDRTGIEGNYAFTLRFAAAGSASADPNRPELFTALQEQLGLKLEPRREPIEVLVIERAEKPEPN
jgi:uncharacterized protein (TIGR03435 family)